MPVPIEARAPREVEAEADLGGELHATEGIEFGGHGRDLVDRIEELTDRRP
ncbi:MAG: hypothetical protein ACYTFV_03050 [Planctomycetota bacterium]|jgi:hypothetical protein